MCCEFYGESELWHPENKLPLSSLYFTFTTSICCIVATMQQNPRVGDVDGVLKLRFQRCNSLQNAIMTFKHSKSLLVICKEGRMFINCQWSRDPRSRDNNESKIRSCMFVCHVQFRNWCEVLPFLVGDNWWKAHELIKEANQFVKARREAVLFHTGKIVTTGSSYIPDPWCL